ncbi:response regulator transcription factor [Curvivirga aplysinae]|uniref:response regulator transcription factor n=1 Tax=Curvivirga aplysinae TaxID=2529852 RepID=UPI0012BCAF74|nr:response regulator [Curvivirga aplysinae]MTI08208.1 response regulator [Curvivirga aplysinae]
MAAVLHIDDDQLLHEVVKENLTEMGHEVHHAENGKIGIELALKLTPDLILMDMEMPVMTGFEATKALRDDGYDGVIAALTGTSKIKDLANAVLIGCDDYIPKPIGEDFKDRVKAAMERGRMRDAPVGEALDDHLFDD